MPTTQKEQTMTKAEILKAIKRLALSQGFYGRVLREIEDDEEALDYLEGQGFKDSLDMIMFFEG